MFATSLVAQNAFRVGASLTTFLQADTLRAAAHTRP